jgi:hypothetical protein
VSTSSNKKKLTLRDFFETSAAFCLVGVSDDVATTSVFDASTDIDSTGVDAIGFGVVCFELSSTACVIQAVICKSFPPITNF